MFGNWESCSLDTPAKYARFAKAYLASALALCSNLSNDDSQLGYEKGCVILYLVHHSVELFLKGALLTKDSLNKNNLNHKLSELEKIYYDNFKGDEYKFNNIFKTTLLNYESIDDDLKNELENISKFRHETYRYPLDKKHNIWKINGLPLIHGIDPIDFMNDLQQLNKTFDCLIPKIFRDICGNQEEK